MKENFFYLKKEKEKSKVLILNIPTNMKSYLEFILLPRKCIVSSDIFLIYIIYIYILNEKYKTARDVDKK